MCPFSRSRRGEERQKRGGWKHTDRLETRWATNVGLKKGEDGRQERRADDLPLCALDYHWTFARLAAEGSLDPGGIL